MDQAGLNVPTGTQVKRKSVGDLAKGFEQKGGIPMGVPMGMRPPGQPRVVKVEAPIEEEKTPTKDSSNLVSPVKQVKLPQPQISVGDQNLQTQQSPPKPKPILVVSSEPVQASIKKSPGNVNADFLAQLNKLQVAGGNPNMKRQSVQLPNTTSMDQFMKQQKDDTDPGAGKLRNSATVELEETTSEMLLSRPIKPRTHRGQQTFTEDQIESEATQCPLFHLPLKKCQSMDVTAQDLQLKPDEIVETQQEVVKVIEENAIVEENQPIKIEKQQEEQLVVNDENKQQNQEEVNVNQCMSQSAQLNKPAPQIQIQLPQPCKPTIQVSQSN